VTKMRNPGGDLRLEVRDAIERAWPDGVVEMSFDTDENYFLDIYPQLRAAMQRFRGARLVHEREPERGPVWFDDSDPEEDPPNDQEPTRSYHLFFVCPDGEAFTYETEAGTLVAAGEAEEKAGDENEMRVEAVAGSGRTGWSVAVSLLAPFAVVTLDGMESFEDGSTSEPSVESWGVTETGQRIDSEAEFRRFKGDRAFEILLRLRARICGVLGRYGITVLSEPEWRKPVPWLRAGEEVFAGSTGGPLRVLDALFFEGL
jgi:hypothetical protein